MIPKSWRKAVLMYAACVGLALQNARIAVWRWQDHESRLAIALALGAALVALASAQWWFKESLRRRRFERVFEEELIALVEREYQERLQK